MLTASDELTVSPFCDPQAVFPFIFGSFGCMTHCGKNERGGKRGGREKGGREGGRAAGEGLTDFWKGGLRGREAGRSWPALE